jgi:hypothetical protein
VRVPDEAGTGKARLTLSFPDWKEGKVTPATFDVHIEEPKVKGNPLLIRPAAKAPERNAP